MEWKHNSRPTEELSSLDYGLVFQEPFFRSWQEITPLQLIHVFQNFYSI
jgi:hypothetical protein